MMWQGGGLVPVLRCHRIRAG